MNKNIKNVSMLKGKAESGYGYTIEPNLFWAYEN